MALMRTVLVVLLAVSAARAGAQGISNQRDPNGNMVRDNGIATQSAPRPMTNSAFRPAQEPSYRAIRVHHRLMLIAR
jgi:hypothetical protein